MFFHGFPGSRVLGSLLDAPARRAGARLIAPERPGCGLSDFKEHRTLLDWPADVVELADSLGLEKFCVAGFSGGGPYAAACAARIPERLAGAGIVSGVAPPDTPSDSAGAMAPLQAGYALARLFPAQFEWLWQLLGPVVQATHGHLSFLYIPSLPAADKAAYADPLTRRTIEADFMEGFRSGPRGTGLELRLLSTPWGFPLEDIRMEVLLWHGEMDLSVPPGMGRHQAAQIPRCRAQFFPLEGHFSMLVNRMEEILRAVAGAA
jgi:pimeloyl-ACP methyl ester carboxylesterase